MLEIIVKRKIIIHMKKIKSMLESIYVQLKQAQIERIYQQLKHELLIAYQSEHAVWAGLAVFFGIGLSSLLWICIIIYQQFHYQDTLAYMPEQPQLIVKLAPNRLFSEPPTSYHQTFNVSYQLAGILFNEDGAKREVMLRLPSGDVRGYHVGDVLADGVKIVDIQAFQVTLEKNGQHKILKLDQYQSDFLSDKPKSGQSLF